MVHEMKVYIQELVLNMQCNVRFEEIERKYILYSRNKFKFKVTRVTQHQSEFNFA